MFSKNPAQICEDQTLVFPLGFANGGKPLQFAPWRFVLLALSIQGRLIVKILAHFWWILVTDF